jgi:hypothetical protein
MALFKSEAERRAERNLQIKRAMREIQKNLQRGEKTLENFKSQAVRAQRIGDKAQLSAIRAAMKRAFSLKRTQERQLLAIEVALQMKDQAESVNAFAAAMKAVSQAVGAAFGRVDMTSGLEEYEKAMDKAATMQDQMDVFLDAASGMNVSDAADSGVTDAELDAFIEDAAVAAEDELVDERVRAGLERIRKEMSR